MYTAMMPMYVKIAVVSILCFTAVSRLLVLHWGMPYAGNVAHEHSLFYDSRATVRDQYRALVALQHFPEGLITEGRTSLMPLLQRYMAAPAVVAWFWSEGSRSAEDIQAQPYSVPAYKIILVNRLISIASSLGILYLFFLILKRWHTPPLLIIFLAALLAINPAEIGLAIHEKTIVLITLVLLGQFSLLDKWTAAQQRGDARSFRWLWWSAILVGVAAGAREQGAVFAGLLLFIGVVWTLKQEVLNYFSIRRFLAICIAPLLGLAATSPDFLVKWWFWTEKITHPGRNWDFNEIIPALPELWHVYVLMFAGTIGLTVFLAAGTMAVTRFRQQPTIIQILLLWLLVYFIIFAIYPLKAPRFIQPFTVFGLILIAAVGVQLRQWITRYIGSKQWSSAVVVFILMAWFVQSVVWGASAFAMFSGQDNRIAAADNFHRTTPTDTSVATYFRHIHDRHIPVNEQQYELYWYDHTRDALVNIEGDIILEDANQWPEYLLIQYEADAVTYTNEQDYITEFRDKALATGNYQLRLVYPKRTFRGRTWGLFGTHSRWVYLNPVVEVYQRRTAE